MTCAGRKIIAVLGGALCFALVAFPTPAHAQKSLIDYLNAGLSEFESSERVLRTRSSMAVLEALADEAALESPYQVQATASQNLNQLPEDATGQLRANSGASSSLRMRTRQGLDAGIAGSLDYNRIDTLGNFYPYRVSLDLAYDLTRGGDDGLAKTQEAIAISAARQQLLQTKQQLVDLRLEYISLLINLYTSNCTLIQQRESKESVAKTVEVATVMVKTRTMSNKDFLNFVELQNSFARDIAISESRVRTLKEQIRGWGAAAYARAAAILEATSTCNEEVDATLERVEKLTLSDERIAEIATYQPAVDAAKEAIVGAQLDIEFEHLEHKPSIAPFVQLDLGQNGLSRDDLVSLFVGVRVDWQPRSPRSAATEKVRQLSLAEARNGRDLLLLDNRTRLQTLWADIQTQTLVIASLRSSIETSKKLIETLETERSVGLVDSLSYNNALINANNSKLQLLSSWAALENSMLELETYLALKPTS